jgi:peptidoglycan/xylan/chitin deacetylase (PgdA/CDA1 family)
VIQFIRKIVLKVLENGAQNIMGTITHVKTEEPLVALTFDDGPHPDHTPELLDILGRYGAHATFFMVGEEASKYPDLVRRVAMAGHAIGNHSWDHPSFPLIRGSERRAQIRACSDALAPYGKKLFRPPYGNQNAMSRFDALRLGYQVVTWNVVAQDWLNDNAETIANRIEGSIQNGSVVLFHDSLYHVIEDRYADREATLKAVGILLERLGPHFRFVTIPELIQHGCPQRSMWFKKPNATFLNKLKGKYNRP